MQQNVIPIIILVLSFGPIAQAIPPPDFLIQLGSQVAQFFAIAAVFLSAIFATFLRIFKTYFQKVWRKKWFWAVVMICILGLSFAVTYWYGLQN